MNVEQVTEKVVDRYAIGPVQLVQPVQGGFLSRNYRLCGSKGRYFLKEYETNDPGHVASVHAAKFHFASAGIPAILPLHTRQDETYWEDAGNYYALFPYVEARQLRRGRLSTTALTSAGEMLAKIHLAGRDADLPGIHVPSLLPRRERFFADAERILGLIEALPGTTEFDDVARECIRLKQALANRVVDASTGLRLQSDHLTHGDYQEANFFFDARDHISHVFDWEKVRMAPRAIELVRSLELICFSDHSDYRPSFASENYRDAHIYLSSYHNRYPLAEEKLVAAYRIHYTRAVHSLWVETEHYINQNSRVDLFLRPGLERLRNYADRFDEHVEEISVGILP